MMMTVYKTKIIERKDLLGVEGKIVTMHETGLRHHRHFSPRAAVSATDKRFSGEVACRADRPLPNSSRSNSAPNVVFSRGTYVPNFGVNRSREEFDKRGAKEGLQPLVTPVPLVVLKGKEEAHHLGRKGETRTKSGREIVSEYKKTLNDSPILNDSPVTESYPQEDQNSETACGVNDAPWERNGGDFCQFKMFGNSLISYRQVTLQQAPMHNQRAKKYREYTNTRLGRTVRNEKQAVKFAPLEMEKSRNKSEEFVGLVVKKHAVSPREGKLLPKEGFSPRKPNITVLTHKPDHPRPGSRCDLDEEEEMVSRNIEEIWTADATRHRVVLPRIKVEEVS